MSVTTEAREAKRAYKRAWDRDYQKNHRGERNEYHRVWRKRNPEKCKVRSRKAKYGITAEEYAALLQKQGGVCRGCKKPETFMIKGKVISLAVDHCHATGKVRGLLCRNCNLILGQANDNPNTLIELAVYLVQSTQESPL